MCSPIPCPYGSYPFTATFYTCSLKVFEFKMPALCFILIQDNHTLCVVIRILIDLWKKCPTTGHKSTHDNSCCWENFRPSASAGGPDFAIIVHHWYFSTQPAARRRWCLLLSTGGSGPSLLQKPCMPTVSMPWNHGPWEMVSVFQGSLSDFIASPLGCQRRCAVFTQERNPAPCGSYNVLTLLRLEG